MRPLRWLGLAVLSISLVSAALAQRNSTTTTTNHVQRIQPDLHKGRARPPRGELANAIAQRHAPDRVLVRFRPTATKQQRQDLHLSVGIRQARAMRIVPGLEIVQLKAGVRVSDAVRQYRRDANVLYAEPDYRVRHMGQPDDPYFANLWGLHNTGQDGGTADADIDAPEAWEITTGSADVVVGTIDTGVDYTHPDLAANIWNNPADCDADGIDDDGNGYVDDCHGIDTYWGDSDPMDDAGHGTHVAGTIGAAGNNALGVVGVNWMVRVAACKFLGPDGSGWDSGAIACLEYFKTLRDAGVNLVATNNSWGGGGYSQALIDAIDAHRQSGILFIAAAGNDAMDNDSFLAYPASFGLPNIVSVAATTRADGLAGFSNWGPHTVHLGAPGDDILSTFPEALGGLYAWGSGTSMATPHVTGVAALLKAQDPSRDWRALRNLLLSSGDTIPALVQTITGKRLNAHGALTCTSAEVLKRMQPAGAIASTVPGITVKLQALHINCASPAGDVTVTIEPGGGSITLVDDGTGADEVAGDGVYTAEWGPTAAGSYTLNFPGGDALPAYVLSPYKFASHAYTYRDITGTSLELDGEYTQLGWIDTPFPVKFGGGSFSRLAVSVNGTISATDDFYDYWWLPLPTHAVSTLIAPSWTALWAYPGTQKNVFWAVSGTEPNRELVVEWRQVESFCYDPTSITFQAVFFENGSDVLFNYKDMVVGTDAYGNDCSGADDGAAASSGIQVGSRVATQYSFEEPVLLSGTALRWTLGSPAPALDSIAPFTAAVGEPGIDLEVWGKNFLPGSSVQWNGAARTTTFVDSTYLQANIPASDLGAAGDIPITVATPDGGTSAAQTIKVYSSYPVPVLSSINPVEVPVGTSGGWLEVNGSNFTSKSVVRWDGNDRQTDRESAARIWAYIPTEDLRQAGTYPITVFNPAPGGGTSAAQTFIVNNPLPTIYNVTPAFARVGDPDFELKLEGTGVDTSVIRWNGADRATTYDPASHSNGTSIPAADVAQAGTAQITLYTPPPGGGVSAPWTFEILVPPGNDEMAQALAFGALPFSDSRDIRAATFNASDPLSSCAPTPGLNSVWYRHDAAAGGSVIYQGSGTILGTAISVWTGTAGALTERACANWILWQSSVQVTVDTLPGATYWIMVTQPQMTIPGPFNFTAALAAPPPSLATVTPAVTGGGTDTPLHITGSNFINGSHAHWDGSDVTTAFVSATELNATMPASAAVGTHQVAIHTPEPGGGVTSELAVTVTGYQFAASPASARVNAGQSASFNLTITPDSGGFDKAVTLTCANPPAPLACSFSTASGTPSTSAMTSTLTVSTTGAVAQSSSGSAVRWAWLGLPFAGCFGMALSWKKRRWLAAGGCLLLAVIAPLASCGGGGATVVEPVDTTYSVTVKAVSGTLQQSTVLSVTVRR